MAPPGYPTDQHYRVKRTSAPKAKPGSEPTDPYAPDAKPDDESSHSNPPKAKPGSEPTDAYLPMVNPGCEPKHTNPPKTKLNSDPTDAYSPKAEPDNEPKEKPEKKPKDTSEPKTQLENQLCPDKIAKIADMIAGLSAQMADMSAKSTVEAESAGKKTQSNPREPNKTQ